MDCPVIQQLRKERDNAKSPKERMVTLAKMSNHKVECPYCNGTYQVAGAQQIRDQAFSGSWGLK